MAHEPPTYRVWIHATWPVAMDATTAGGKVELAGLQAAYATGKPATIIGAGNCSVYPETETINLVHTND